MVDGRRDGVSGRNIKRSDLEPLILMTPNAIMVSSLTIWN